MKPRVVLFVCTGNTCRSPMAEILFREMLKKDKIVEVEIFSRGVGALDDMPASHGTREALREIGLSAEGHLAHPLRAEDVQRADLILVMEDAHRAIILSEYPEAAKKLFLLKAYAGLTGSLEIADPVGGSPEDYRKSRIEIQNALSELLKGKFS